MPILRLCRTNWFLHCGFDLQNSTRILEFVFAIEQINTGCQFVWFESETNRHLNGWLHTGPHQNRPMGFTANPSNPTCCPFLLLLFSSTHFGSWLISYPLCSLRAQVSVLEPVELQVFNTHTYHSYWNIWNFTQYYTSLIFQDQWYICKNDNSYK